MPSGLDVANAWAAVEDAWNFGTQDDVANSIAGLGATAASVAAALADSPIANVASSAASLAVAAETIAQDKATYDDANAGGNADDIAKATAQLGSKWGQS